MIISNNKVRTCLLLLTFVLMGLPSLAFYQGGSQTPASQQSVKLNILVTDRHGQLITDLRQEDFRISDNGQPQKIESFFYGEVPVSYALLIDNSGSMRRVFPDVINASKVIIGANRPADQTLLSEFNERTNIGIASRWSNDKELLMQALQTLTPHGATSLFDALSVIAERLDRKENAEGNAPRRKAIIVITDGVDKDSAITEDHLIKQLNGIDLQVFFVGLTFNLNKDKSVFRPSEQVTAEESMKRIAAVTGGQAFFPHSSKDVGDMMTALADRMRRQYVIGYYPTTIGNKNDFHKVKIENINPSLKCTIITRAGYTEHAH